jgi:MFS family permease
VGGLAIGVASVLAPLYIAEISPRQIRGRLVSLNQMAIRLGRRPLMMLASAGMAAALFVLALLFQVAPPTALLILAVIFIYVGSFGVGLGPGVRVVVSKLFPTLIRGWAMSIATVALWLACILITYTFLSLVEAVGSTGAFGIYSALSAVNFLFVWWVLPET